MFLYSTHFVMKIVDANSTIDQWLNLSLLPSIRAFVNIIVLLFKIQGVDGQWSLWNAWGACSKTCGGGTKTRHRRCDSPSPYGSGQNCVGNPTESIRCNTKLCPPRKIWRILCFEFDSKYQCKMSYYIYVIHFLYHKYFSLCRHISKKLPMQKAMAMFKTEGEVQ